jgi:diguanylate cyclase (GGDEF)-like protein
MPSKLKPTQIGFLVAAIAYCVGVFFLDISTPSTYNESLLLVLAFALIYPVRRTWATIVIFACTIIAAIMTAFFEPGADTDAGTWVNIWILIVAECGIAFMTWRVTSVENALYQLSTTDPLTGAYNRRHFMVLMDRERKISERYGTGLSLLLLDIDHFKKINDTYGHPTGDEAIKAIAETCHRQVRSTDTFCRYGGEEFVVALPNTDEAGAAIAAEYLRKAVSKIELIADGNRTVQFTVSIGVASFVRKSTVEQLIECADQALYAAKLGGRNQVQIGHYDSIDSTLSPKKAEA